MKKILLAIAAVMAAATMSAKVVKITLKDGSSQVMTTSQLSAIDFNADGTVSLTSYDGNPIELPGETFTKVTVANREEVFETIERPLTFSYNDIEFFSRDATYVNFVYPSVDPQGNPISLSGAIVVPQDIYNGEVKADGILLVNHYTISHKDEIPTRGYNYTESMLIANPLRPNYIIIESDFYGFGATERFPQAYIFGTANGRASLDALRAGKRILTDLGFDYGKLLFTAGYSSGGFDAMATLKEAEINPDYSDIHFDKTFSGGGPYDIVTVYNEYVKQDSIKYLVSVPLMLVAFNENGNLGLDYNDIFNPLIADHIDDWILSKNYATWDVNYLIGTEHTLTDMLRPAYLDVNSPQARVLLDYFARKSMTATDWTPDPEQNIYLMQSRGDDYISFLGTRRMIDFLADAGYEKSCIPGKTHLQTNTLITDMGHLATALVFAAQTAASLKAWPLMYDEDGNLNSTYSDIVNREIDPVEMMRTLDGYGFDCRGIILAVATRLKEIGAKQGIDIKAILAEQLAKHNLDIPTLIEMSDDAGFDVVKLITDLATYFSEYDLDPEDALDVDHALHAIQSTSTGNPALQFEQQMTDWYKQENIR